MKKLSLIEKEKQLGMSYGKAINKLNKIILFELAKNNNMLGCYRCKEKIQNIEEFSIEHKKEWLKSLKPSKDFFDLDNIAFSHLVCNIKHSASKKRSVSKVDKDKTLGMNFSTATNRLRKKIMFHLAGKVGKTECYHCSKIIKVASDFTIEHEIPWLYSVDPINLFFDIKNISFSHRKCNVDAARCSSFVRSKAKFKGVTFHKDKVNKPYSARIGVIKEGKTTSIFLGYYATPKLAAMAYDEGVKKYLGKKAVTNQSIGLLKDEEKCSNCSKPITKYSKSGMCNPCSNRSNSKIERPSRLQLIELILNKPFLQIGKDYGVSDNAVRKWCKYEGLPTLKSDIKLQRESLEKELADATSTV